MNGDSEGNFSVLAFKEAAFSIKDANFTCDRHMITVATFHQGNNTNYPVSELANFFLFICPETRASLEKLCGFLSLTVMCLSGIQIQ